MEDDPSSLYPPGLDLRMAMARAIMGQGGNYLEPIPPAQTAGVAEQYFGANPLPPNMPTIPGMEGRAAPMAPAMPKQGGGMGMDQYQPQQPGPQDLDPYKNPYLMDLLRQRSAPQNQMPNFYGQDPYAMQAAFPFARSRRR